MGLFTHSMVLKKKITALAGELLPRSGLIPAFFKAAAWNCGLLQVLGWPCSDVLQGSNHRRACSRLPARLPAANAGTQRRPRL